MSAAGGAATPLKVGVVYGEYHHEIAEAMFEAARKTIAEEGGEIARVIRVPGIYEAPLAVKTLLDDPTIAIVVVLGYIERGETLHGEVMGHVVHHALVDLELRYGKPLGLGIIGPGATVEQAEARKVDYAQAAARAAFKLYRAVRGQ